MVVTSGVDVWRGCGGVVVDGMRRLSRDSGGDGGGVVAVVDPSDEREEYTMMMMGVSLKFLAGAGGGLPTRCVAGKSARRRRFSPGGCTRRPSPRATRCLTPVSGKTEKLSGMSFFIKLL
ncbi:hypothetical protein Tco_1297274 [Tanacetum coccineum]